MCHLLLRLLTLSVFFFLWVRTLCLSLVVVVAAVGKEGFCVHSAAIPMQVLTALVVFPVGDSLA